MSDYIESVHIPDYLPAWLLHNPAVPVRIRYYMKSAHIPDYLPAWLLHNFAVPVHMSDYIESAHIPDYLPAWLLHNFAVHKVYCPTVLHNSDYHYCTDYPFLFSFYSKASFNLSVPGNTNRPSFIIRTFVPSE